MEIMAPPFNSCKKYLRLVDLYLALRHLIDFSPFLAKPNNLIMRQIRERLSPGEFTKFLVDAKEHAGIAGKWKLEHPISELMQGILTFYVVKHKCYASLIHLEDKEGVSTSFLKKCLKGAVLRSRTANLDLTDFFRFGNPDEVPSLQTEMPKIASRNWSVYFINMSRYEPTVFSRKRYLVDRASGLTVPFHFLADPE